MIVVVVEGRKQVVPDGGDGHNCPPERDCRVKKMKERQREGGYSKMVQESAENNHLSQEEITNRNDIREYFKKKETRQ